MSNNAPDYENDLVFPPVEDVEEKADFIIQALEGINDKLTQAEQAKSIEEMHAIICSVREDAQKIIEETIREK